jgi:hypothetical protein
MYSSSFILHVYTVKDTDRRRRGQMRKGGRKTNRDT